MKIPYVSALGESDDECVSLANHLDCYLMAQDSDYYCYKLNRGYLPFDYVNIESKEKDSFHYLEARLYHIDLLLEQFQNLQHPTLVLACCLCGNDYISSKRTETILNSIVDTVGKSKQMVNNRNNRPNKFWCAMEWMAQFSTIDLAFEQLSQLIYSETERIKVTEELRSAIQTYLSPSDTLVYRFISPENRKLQTDDDFTRRARTYLNTLDKVIEDLCTL